MNKGRSRRRPRNRVFYPWTVITNPAKILLLALTLLFLYWTREEIDFVLTKILCGIGSKKYYCRELNVP